MPGGYSDRMIAHESMCFPIPDSVADDDRGALRSVLRRDARDPQGAAEARARPCIVYGCGPLGLLTIHALAKLWPDVRIVAVDLHGYLEPYAKEMGAHEFVAAGGEELVEQIAELTRSKVRRVRFALPG